MHAASRPLRLVVAGCPLAEEYVLVLASRMFQTVNLNLPPAQLRDDSVLHLVAGVIAIAGRLESGKLAPHPCARLAVAGGGSTPAIDASELHLWDGGCDLLARRTP